jgi:hypothetical protein
MFVDMDWANLSNDELEQQLLANRELQSGLQAMDLNILEELDRRQVATADGSRSLSEWVSSRLDLGSETARTLVRTMRLTVDRADLRIELASGTVSLDRVEALSRIHEDVGLLEHFDVAGVRAEAAKRARLSSLDEYRSASDRFLVMQPSLDESWWRLWGGLDGPSGAIVDKVLSQAADLLPEMPDGSTCDRSWRKATALVESLISDDPLPAHITVFVDANEAVTTEAEAGVRLEAGPKAGTVALTAILCDAITELTVRTEDGRYMDYGRRTRTVPPRMKRALLDKYHQMCAADGCNSRHRLEAHHIVPWSEGGATDQEGMTLLCWYHHHVVVHERGFQVQPHPEHGRIRFKPADRTI